MEFELKLTNIGKHEPVNSVLHMNVKDRKGNLISKKERIIKKEDIQDMLDYLKIIGAKVFDYWDELENYNKPKIKKSKEIN